MLRICADCGEPLLRSELFECGAVNLEEETQCDRKICFACREYSRDMCRDCRDEQVRGKKIVPVAVWEDQSIFLAK